MGGADAPSLGHGRARFPRCLRRMRIVAIHPKDAIRGMLECLGLRSRAPQLATTAEGTRHLQGLESVCLIAPVAAWRKPANLVLSLLRILIEAHYRGNGFWRRPRLVKPCGACSPPCGLRSTADEIEIGLTDDRF